MAVSKVKSRVSVGVDSLFGGNASGPVSQQLGRVGGKFAPLAALASGEPGKAPIDGYLELLLKLKGKMAALSASGDPEGSSRQLVQATISGSGSEFAETSVVVENLLSKMDDSMKAAVQPILVRPVFAAYALVVPLAEADINRAWSQQVYSQWTNLAGKYPFADSSNDAAMADIAKFLKPGDGTLARFVEKYHGPLVVRRGNTFSARSWGGRGVGLGGNFLNGISRLTEAGSNFLQEGEGSRFELQPSPTAGISEILIEIDGQKLPYRNGPQIWTAFTWPGAGAQGARIQVTSNSGATVQVQNFSGRLGLMRLLDAAHAENPVAASSTLDWRFKVGPGFSPANSKNAAKDGFYPQGIRFGFRMISGTNPLHLNNLRHHSLPPKIGN